ncbi:MAG: hypothetical protein ACK40L_17755 [Hydrogenophaga sp.]
MSIDHPSQFDPSWFAGLESTSPQGREQRLRAFVRLWRAFMRARVVIAVVLLALQALLALLAQLALRAMLALI